MCQYYDIASNTILNELCKIKDIEFSEGICTPLPNYLYIQRYGRRAQEQMDRILQTIGKKDWFLFKAEEKLCEGGLIKNFNMELHRHADTGKEFTGCSLIELSKEAVMSDTLPGFLEYLKEKENEQNIYYIFTVKNTKDAVSVQKCIELYFFTRIVYAEEFSIEEQLDIIKKTCEEYGFSIDHKEQVFIMRGLKDRKWKENEHVEFILQNAARAVIYEAILEDKMNERLISMELSMKLLENLQKKAEKEKTFGFQQREFEIKEEYQYE